MFHEPTRMLLAASALLLAALLATAGEDKVVARGKMLYHDTGDFEYPSCEHCHATVPKAEESKKTGHIRPASSIFNSSHRGSWKNSKPGKGPRTAGEAGNVCVRAFQKRKALPATDLAALDAYILTLSPDKTVSPRKILYRPALPESFDGGDPKKGKQKVEVYCGTCHGAAEDDLQFELKAGKVKKRVAAMKVRGWIKDKKKGGIRFKPNAGQMSFFAKDRLPDADLLDILAYIGK